MRTLTRIEMDDITELAGLAENSATATYSGRYMYGAQCIGWECESTTDILRLGAAISTVAGLNVPDLINSAQVDSMGLGMIVYFPFWTCPDLEDEDQT